MRPERILHGTDEGADASGLEGDGGRVLERGLGRVGPWFCGGGVVWLPGVLSHGGRRRRKTGWRPELCCVQHAGRLGHLPVWAAVAGSILLLPYKLPLVVSRSPPCPRVFLCLEFGYTCTLASGCVDGGNTPGKYRTGYSLV